MQGRNQMQSEFGAHINPRDNVHECGLGGEDGGNKTCGSGMWRHDQTKDDVISAYRVHAIQIGCCGGHTNTYQGGR